jgi:hypothetical protein
LKIKMKKIVPLLFFFFLSAVAFSQSDSIAAKSMMPTSISWQKICESMDCYGQLYSHARPLQYNPDVNVISYIHQKGATYPVTPPVPVGTDRGVIVAEISSDWGMNWDSTCIWAGTNNLGRTPQGAIYSAAGNTNIANAYVVASGPTTNSNIVNGAWYASKLIGVTGSTVFNATASTTLNAQQFISNQSPTYAVNQARHGYSRYGFTSTSDGVVRSLSLIQNNQDTLGRPAKMRGVAIVKGSFNAGVFNWTTDSLIPNCIVSQGAKVLSPEVQMAWDQAGIIGYAVMIGAQPTATLSNRGYQPIIYKTTNSGATWTTVPGINFNHPSMDLVTDHLERVSVTPDTFALPHFENYDLAVDSAGLLHIGATISSGRVAHDDSLDYVHQYTLSINGPNKKYLWGHTWGRRPYIYDFVGNGTSSWKAIVIDSMSTEDPGSFTTSPGYPENPWDPSGVNGSKINMGSRLQLGRTPDGKYITFSWAESDTNFTTGGVKYNVLPNIKARLLQARCDPSVYFGCSNEINVSKPASGQGTVNPNVGSRATLHFMAPVVSTATRIPGAGSYSINVIVPFSVTNSNPWSQWTNNAIWFSRATLLFTFNYLEAGCSNSISENTYSAHRIQLFPNPTDSKVNLIFEMKEASKADISIYNIIGKEVKCLQMNAEIGTNEISFDVSDLKSGIYFVNLKAGNLSVTRKLVIE